MNSKKITISKDDVKTQKDMVLWHLKSFKTLTSYQAFKEYGITRLSAIIFNIRKEGYSIVSNTESIKNRFNRTVDFAIYTYTPPVKIEKYKQTSLLDFT
tara:strand:+ start:169 stop:465 length:297 start_codon:yes stop_codon:yes gene_type:complete